jgi:hypothetical protein
MFSGVSTLGKQGGRIQKDGGGRYKAEKRF